MSSRAYECIWTEVAGPCRIAIWRWQSGEGEGRSTRFDVTIRADTLHEYGIPLAVGLPSYQDALGQAGQSKERVTWKLMDDAITRATLAGAGLG